MISQYVTKIREKSGFDNLEKREKLIIFIGTCVLVIFLVLQFGVAPYFDAKKKLDKSISKKQSELKELEVLQQEYINIMAEAGGIKDQLGKRAPTFSLFSFLDTQASESNIKELISYMKPSTSEAGGELQESIVEMKLQKISLNQLVSYLERIESPENVVSIKRISIQESGKEKGLLEVILQIVTFIENS